VVLFTSGQLTPGYRRYLERDLRRTFGFQGTPVRLVVRVRTRERATGGDRRG
jgi:GTPase